jgi:hypothetical protein
MVGNIESPDSVLLNDPEVGARLAVVREGKREPEQYAAPTAARIASRRMHE